MKKILLVCVNYNSYRELNSFLDSIENAYRQSDNLFLKVCIVDNSVEKKRINIESYGFDCNILLCDNIGYFGAFTTVLDKEDNIHLYDYVILSNVDLVVDENIFKTIPMYRDETVAWISPSIISKYEGRDKGIGLINRPSKTKLRLLSFIYKYPFIEYVIRNTVYRRKSLVKKKQSPHYIYSGHGSFIILTKSFFNNISIKSLHYPMFLFCEELFLGELIKLKKMRVVFDERVKISDTEHVSTSKMSSAFNCKCQRDSVNYILKRFYGAPDKPCGGGEDARMLTQNCR